MCLYVHVRLPHDRGPEPHYNRRRRPKTAGRFHANTAVRTLVRMGFANSRHTTTRVRACVRSGVRIVDTIASRWHSYRRDRSLSLADTAVRSSFLDTSAERAFSQIAGPLAHPYEYGGRSLRWERTTTEARRRDGWAPRSRLTMYIGSSYRYLLDRSADKNT